MTGLRSSTGRCASQAPRRLSVTVARNGAADPQVNASERSARCVRAPGPGRSPRAYQPGNVTTEQQLLWPGKQSAWPGVLFADAITTGCWYPDRHPNRPTPGRAQEETPVWPSPYDIPYRALLSRGIENLLVAGRRHSATAHAAASTRVTATAMALGEAAGTAAALAVQRRTSVQELRGEEVRDVLWRRGAGPLVGTP
jgi:hypothetical protein